jgi:uncharacterized membrane protein YczE
MELVMISLLAGCFLGASNLIAEKWIAYLDKIVMGIVFILLIAVGLGIGSNQELIANLTVLGWKALVIAALSTGGSVIALWLAVSKFNFLASDPLKERQL